MGVCVRTAKPIRKPRPIGDGVCELELTGGFVALIDEADSNLVGVCSWCAHFNGKNKSPYVKGRPFGKSGQQMRLHRYLVGATGFQVDHIDGDTLNNRRSNLRVATRQENNRNRKTVTGCVPFKGVSMRDNLFVASITLFRKPSCIGIYPTAIEAGIAYDQAAVRYFGEFAATNASLGLLSVEASQ